jgi:hypothetical protein
MIRQGSQRVIKRTHQCPTKTLRHHRVAESLLRWAQPPPEGFQLEEKDFAVT